MIEIQFTEESQQQASLIPKKGAVFLDFNRDYVLLISILTFSFKGTYGVSLQFS